ncbi:hypothetical protein ACH5RR_020096 [Cinchona calisaya]|uniref:Peroxidase n=1 Tax=Cinchona calisaya TaxID=153742 RepID=A0ABD2ZGG9_9GENT
MKICNLLIIMVAFLASSVLGNYQSNVLSPNYYWGSCDGVEEIVREITWKRVAANNTLPAKLIRMHFHDCFVRGCDGSVLLDSTANNTAEKAAIPNLSLGGFDVIDEIKKALELKCPRTVSCADIVALAARDAVSYQFRRSMWEVLTGRKDGNISRESEVLPNIPSPFSNFSTLNQNFVNKGLDARDLVVLSGAHTIGVGHCNLFSNRLYNFTGKGDQDPSLNRNYATFLKRKCPNLAATSAVNMDPITPTKFDTNYYVILKRNEGLFQSDAALLTNTSAKSFVNRLINPSLFLSEFARSMVRLGNVGVLTGDSGEIRENCRVVNP